MKKKTVWIDPFDFNQLIQPISWDEFAGQYWEKKPLLLTKRASGYKDLLTLKDVDFLLSTLISPVKGWVRFINNKKELGSEAYHSQKDLLNMNAVMQGFHEGNTIILNHLHSRFEPIRRLANTAEKALGQPIGVNLYLTPQKAQGFDAHYDTHDVFILQIEGEKLWKIYDVSVPYPLKGEKEYVKYDKALQKPLYELYLQPGDLLYIPRGFIHEALTAKHYSLHLTMGVHSFTWLDWIMEIGKQEPELRKALPLQALLKDKELGSSQSQWMQKIFQNKAIRESAFQALKKQFSQSSTDPVAGFSSLGWENSIQEDTFLKLKAPLSLKAKGKAILLSSGQDTFEAPAHIEPLLRHMMKYRRFSLRTLPDTHDLESKAVLIKWLAKLGALVLETQE